MSEDSASINATNGTARAPPEGVIVAYSGLYAMALLSICYGSYRSARLVRQHRKEKKKMENSITFSDAKWFPVTASCVLFGLYCLFRKKECLRFVRETVFSRVEMYLPAAFGQKIDNFFVYALSNGSNSTPADPSKNATLPLDRSDGVFELFTKENISYFLLVFFCYEGVFALARLFKPFVGYVSSKIPAGVKRRLGHFDYYRLSFTRSRVEKVDHERVREEEQDEETGPARKQFADFKFDTHDVVGVAVCSLVGSFHVWRRHWLTNNAFGLAFTLYGIEALHLSSFKGGVVLLAGLFVYDIFWVFATDVMSTVATTVNAPILLMFPQDFLGGGAAGKFAMLGLGDIVIPGIFLALLLRYGERERDASYFYATVVAYGLGLMLTIGVMHYFKAAQPALLYLVPACVGTPALLALFKGDLKKLLAYDEADLVKEDKKKKNDAAKGSRETNRKDKKEK